MKATTTNYYGENFEIELYFSHQIAGYGHWHILCEVTYEGEKKTFKHLTTNSEFIDSLNEARSNDATWEKIQKVYFDKAFDDLEEIIREWCEQVAEEKMEEND